MSQSLHVLGIAGSLRAASYNRAVLHTAQTLAPPGMTLEIVTLDGLPMYNNDVDNAEAQPAAVTQFKQRLHEAEALLIVTPEYNFSIPGVLKNALDWASRPTGFPQPPLRDKPVAIMSASPGLFGGVRAQMHLREILFGLGTHPLPSPQVLIPRIHEKVQDGQVVDEETRGFIEGQLNALLAWAHRLRVEG